MRLLDFDFPTGEWVAPLGFAQKFFYFVKQQRCSSGGGCKNAPETELCRVRTKYLDRLSMAKGWSIGFLPIEYFEYTTTSLCGLFFYSFGKEAIAEKNVDERQLVRIFLFSSLEK